MNEFQTVAALQDTTPNLRNDKQAAANKAKDNQERAATCGGGGREEGMRSTWSGCHTAHFLAATQHNVWVPHSTLSVFLGDSITVQLLWQWQIMYLVYLEHLKYL